MLFWPIVIAVGPGFVALYYDYGLLKHGRKNRLNIPRRAADVTWSTSDVAVCCSNASRNSRLSRATSDSELSAAERRLLRVFGAFRPFGLSALRGRALAGVWPALELLFIASTRMSAQGIVAGHSNTGHGTRAHPTLSRAAARPAQPRQGVDSTTNASSGLSGAILAPSGS